MRRRALQILTLVSVLWFSWLMMMLVHEAGHVIGALCTGGTVVRFVWHPAALSRTDVSPNPSPLIEVCAGPIVGCAVPLLVAAFTRIVRVRTAYLIEAAAGFCLIANGAYIGVGAFDPVGDARLMLLHGMPRLVMIGSGVAAFAGGFWIWHRIGENFRNRPNAESAERRDATVAIFAATLLTVVGFLFGDAGL